MAKETWRLTHYFEFAGQKMQNVYWVDVEEGFALTNVVDAFVTNVVTPIRAAQVTAVTNTRIGMRKEGTANPELSFQPAGWPVGGGVGGHGGPPQDAMLIQFYTAGGSYPLRAPKYYVGYPESEQANGTFEALQVARMNDIIAGVAAWQVAGGANWEMVAYQPANPNATPPKVKATSKIVSGIPNSIVARQGQRKIGRGS